ncbi:SigE family RNA polymerase sigma factor [Nocardioides sp. R-C-SC26]|uniref:SigE family RNA polymerase sigma factor n=1 Tax=Nocardioides sp. R-C-SC26 TaxID=2870414 RepID=UPI001E5BBE3D|nr:SigE family RNA polymerase sigma factor [Nocardioides sp. R-C-SC26]
MSGPIPFDDWVAARGPALLRLAFVLTGNAVDAEDVVQEALSRAYPRWSRIAGLADPDAYVRRMVVNAHTSRWRAWRRRVVPVAGILEEADGPSTEQARLAPDERDRLWRACLALPAAQRVAVVLRFYEELEYAEIAAIAGVPEGTVRSRVSRGVAALRAGWDADEREQDER